MTSPAPVSVTLYERHIAWLDARRSHGSITRSAALRQAIDTLIAIDAAGGVTTAHAQPVATR